MGTIRIKLDKYSGSDEENFEDSLNLFEKFAKLNQWSETDKVDYIIFYLEGPAKICLENFTRDNNRSWKQIIDHLKDRFNVDKLFDYFVKLENLKYEGNVNLQEYIHNIEKYCTILDLNVESKVLHLIKGLPVSMINKIDVLDNSTFEKAIINLKRIQVGEKMKQERISKTINQNICNINNQNSNAESEDSTMIQKLKEQIHNLEQEIQSLLNSYSDNYTYQPKQKFRNYYRENSNYFYDYDSPYYQSYTPYDNYAYYDNFHYETKPYHGHKYAPYPEQTNIIYKAPRSERFLNKPSKIHNSADHTIQVTNVAPSQPSSSKIKSEDENCVKLDLGTHFPKPNSKVSRGNHDGISKQNFKGQQSHYNHHKNNHSARQNLKGNFIYNVNRVSQSANDTRSTPRYSVLNEIPNYSYSRNLPYYIQKRTRCTLPKYNSRGLTNKSFSNGQPRNYPHKPKYFQNTQYFSPTKLVSYKNHSHSSSFLGPHRNSSFNFTGYNLHAQIPYPYVSK